MSLSIGEIAFILSGRSFYLSPQPDLITLKYFKYNFAQLIRSHLMRWLCHASSSHNIWPPSVRGLYIVLKRFILLNATLSLRYGGTCHHSNMQLSISMSSLRYLSFLGHHFSSLNLDRLWKCNVSGLNLHHKIDNLKSHLLIVCVLSRLKINWGYLFPRHFKLFIFTLGFSENSQASQVLNL